VVVRDLEDELWVEIDLDDPSVKGWIRGRVDDLQSSMFVTASLEERAGKDIERELFHSKDLSLYSFLSLQENRELF